MRETDYGQMPEVFDSCPKAGCDGYLVPDTADLTGMIVVMAHCSRCGEQVDVTCDSSG